MVLKFQLFFSYEEDEVVKLDEKNIRPRANVMLQWDEVCMKNYFPLFSRINGPVECIPSDPGGLSCDNASVAVFTYINALIYIFRCCAMCLCFLVLTGILVVPPKPLPVSYIYCGDLSLVFLRHILHLYGHM